MAFASICGSARKALWLPFVCLSWMASCTFVVDSTADAPDVNPGDNVCARAAPGPDEPPGLCTLRAAIMEANANVLTDRVEVPAGTYTLKPASQGGGVLTITSSVIVRGDVNGGTVIDAGGGTCASAGASNGGVFLVESGTVTLGYLTIQGGRNQAGGGVRVNGGDVVVSDARIQHNHGFTGGGGLLVDDGGEVNVYRTEIVDNCATGAFGGGVWNSGELFIHDSLIANNTSNRAGGIRNSGVLNLRSTTVSGNRALSPQAGVGGISQNGFAFLNNATVTNNTGVGDDPASFQGGGIQTSPGETTVVKNSIIAGNDGGLGPDDCVGELTSDSRYNLIGDSTGCVFLGLTTTYLLDVDPQLGPLASNGGPTRTHLPGTGSPAINAAYPFPPPAADACQPGDQRGVPRPQGGRCDMGAVEVTSASAFVTRLILVDAAADTDLFALRNGDQLDLSELPPSLSVRAVVPGAAPGSVVFGVDSDPSFQIENLPPYALGGDSPAGNYLPVAVTAGAHTLTATPFAGPNGTGAAGGALTITLNVIN